MPVVHLPSVLAAYAQGSKRVPVEHAPGVDTVGAVLTTLGARHPGVRQRVLDDQGTLRRHVNVFVNGENVRSLKGLATPVGPDDEVWVIPSVSGGA